MKIKITKCSKEIMWYKNHVGEIYEETFIDTDGSSVVYLDEKTLGSVLKGDFEYLK